MINTNYNHNPYAQQIQTEVSTVQQATPLGTSATDASGALRGYQSLTQQCACDVLHLAGATPATTQDLLSASAQQVIDATLSAIADPAGPGVQTSEFAEHVQQALIPDAQGHIHEEEFHYAITGYLLQKVSPDIAAKFQQEFEARLGLGTPPVLAEEAVSAALQATVDAGLLTQEAADVIHRISFQAAQLDDKPTTLFDNRGSAEDPTIATASIDTAVQRANLTLWAIREGGLTL